VFVAYYTLNWGGDARNAIQINNQILPLVIRTHSIPRRTLVKYVYCFRISLTKGKKMKKYFLAGLLGFVLIWPLSLESKQLFVQMSFGLMHVGHVEDSWHMTTDYYNFSSVKGKRMSPGMDITLEFIYQIHPNFSLAVGTGYISRILNGSSGHFSSSEGDSYQEFSLSPELRSEINPFYLSGIFSFPVMSGFKASFIGGVGYYIGKIKCTATNLKMESGSFLHLDGLFESNAHTLGYHVGAGIDFDLSLNLFLSVEALYRVVNFRKFKIPMTPFSGTAFYFASSAEEMENLTATDPTFLYELQFFGEEDMGDIEYRVSNFSYSGFSFRAGLKFKF